MFNALWRFNAGIVLAAYLAPEAEGPEAILRYGAADAPQTAHR